MAGTELYDCVMDPNLAQNKYPNFTEKHHSFMRKALTKELWEKLKDKKTESGWTLARAVNTGVVNDESDMGCHAGDLESYQLFAEFFDPVIEAYHGGYKKEARHVTDMDPCKLGEGITDPEAVVSTRIRVARNLAGFPLNPSSTKEQRLETEAIMKQVFAGLEGDLAGTYFSLATTSEEQKKQLVEDHFLFRPGDKFQAASGYHQFWPAGRGIFHNHEKTFLLWINEGDHIRIISMQKGGDVKAVFGRLSRGVHAIEEGIRRVTGKGAGEDIFLRTDHHGMITCCPSNLGSGLRGSMHIRLPKLLASQDFNELNKFVKTMACQARGTSGEHSAVTDTVDISNYHRLGRPEYDLVHDMIKTVNTLTGMEKAK